MISHFKTLGINVIQLLPFTEFASPLSLGYNSMLPYALEADYGTPAEFKEFIQACHDNGILIFLDVIFNHFDINAGDPDPKPYSLADYDGWETSDFPDGIFFYDNKNINTPGGSPRPNYSISGVRHYLVDNIRMWIEEYKIDGFRFDSTKCMRKRQSDNIGGCNGNDIIVNERNHAWELMQTINNLIVEAYPQTFSIAEDLDGNAWITKKCADGGAGFDSQWDSELQTKLTEVLTKPFDDLINLNELAYTLCNPLGGEALHRVIYLETNDTVRNNRTVSLIEPGNPEGWYARKKTMLGLGIIMTSPGIPMLFQGQEFLSWQPWDDQKPINWEQLKRFPKYFRFFCDLIRLRTNENSQTNGLCGENIQIIQCNNQTKVLAYRRWSKTDGSDNIIVVANFSCNIYHSYTIGFPVFGKWHIRLNSDSNSYSDSNDFECTHCYDATASPGNFNNQLYHGDIAIGPYAIIILTQ
jgi:1,4-alpha-glucan branching enzyme